MPGSIPLRQSDSAVVAADGTATVRLRPDGAREIWYPDTVASSGNSDVLESVCKVYCGPTATAPYFVDATGAGSFGDSTGRVAGHRIGRHWEDSIIGVWSGADVGSTVTLTVTGTKSVT